MQGKRSLKQVNTPTVRSREVYCFHVEWLDIDSIWFVFG